MGTMMTRAAPVLIILESHPVQYHAPVYREACRLAPGLIKVIYASDCSVRGYKDKGFGRHVAWDVPLLEGYPVQVLNSERGEPLQGPFSLHGWDIVPLLWRVRPRAVLFASQLYEFSWAAYLCCILLGIDIWWRMETQDEAHRRGLVKGWIRNVIYRLVYAPVAGAFYVGELNRRHLVAHGVPSDRLVASRYCVVDRLDGVTFGEKARRRRELRARLGVQEEQLLISFFGKIISKKNPALPIAAWQAADKTDRQAWRLLYVGDGELRGAIEQQAASSGAPARFLGFINQSELDDYYLASDVVVLPSRREGETWGLVVNEALLAGCAVVVSAAAGCAMEFGQWSRVRVLPEGDAGVILARFITELSRYKRDFDWCREEMKAYSIDAAAQSIAGAVRKLPT